MSRLFSHSLPRDILDISREMRMLTVPDSLSYSSDIRDILPLHLPDVRTPAQYLIDLGLGPVLSRRISSVYMDFVARYRQVFELHFRRVIHGGCQHPKYYRDIFAVQFNSTIQVWESRIMLTARVWLCQAGLSPTSLSLDVRISGYAIFFTKLIYLWFRYVWMLPRRLRFFRDLAAWEHRLVAIKFVFFLPLFLSCSLTFSYNELEGKCC
jgi:hypothetical protein